MKSVYYCNDLKIFNRIKTIRLQVLTNERFKADNSRYMRGRYCIMFLVSVHVQYTCTYFHNTSHKQKYLKWTFSYIF